MEIIYLKVEHVIHKSSAYIFCEGKTCSTITAKLISLPNGNLRLSLVLSFFLFFILKSTSVFSQTTTNPIFEKRLDYHCEQKTTAEILIELSQLLELSIGFDNESLDNKLRSYSFRNKSLSEILKSILIVQNQDFLFVDDGILLTKKKIIDQFIISGFIEDKSTGEALIAATIYNPDSGKGTVSNEFGYFSLKTTAGAVILEASYLGYEKVELPISVERNHSVRFSLEPSLSFEPVEVVETKVGLRKNTLPFSNELQMNSTTLKAVPALGGEPDLFRYLQQQPGITSGADGLGGLHVRGGNVDQNLIMLDGVPIFNPSHALGLFSIFNSSIVNSATMHRSGFSARFGGHLSSVLDVRSKEGNIKSFAASVDLSTMATKAMIELPFGNEKGGFLLAMRRTHLDPLIIRQSSKVKTRNGSTGNTNFNFYDINAKVNFKPGLKDRFFLSFYRGADDYNDFTAWESDFEIDDSTSQFYAQEEQYIDWSNTIGSLRWNHLYGDRLFSNVTGTISRFNYQNLNVYLSDILVDGNEEFSDFYNRFYSSIVDFRLKTDFDFYLNSNHKIIWGAEYLNRNFEPGSLSGDARLIINPDEDYFFEDLIPDVDTINYFPTSEFNIYLEDQIKIGENWVVNLGLRNSFLFGTDYNFNSLQPRLKINYQPSNKIGLELGASRMTQFLHLVTASDAGLPNDLWVPSTANVLPQHAWEVSSSFGYQHSDKLRVSTSVYYKYLENVLAYSQEASLPTLMDNDPDFWEEQVEQGTGLAYGWETQVQYIHSNRQLAINYTLANSNRAFENLNNGFVFPSRYDRRHVLQINYSQRFKAQWELQLGWTYRSGQPISLIKVPYEFSPLSTPNGIETELVGDVNSFQLIDYHRLDGNLKWNSKNLKHQLTFGAYNIYNFKNPIYAYQVESEVTGDDDGIRSQLGLGIIPTIGYHWKIK